MYSQYRNQKLELVRVDTKETRETVLKFLEKAPSSATILLDQDGKVGRLFGLWAHPTTYLIDRKGLVRYRAMGVIDWVGPEALSVIEMLLKEKW